MVMDTKERNTHYKWQLEGRLSRGSAWDLLIRGDHLLLFDFTFTCPGGLCVFQHRRSSVCCQGSVCPTGRRLL